MAKKQPKSKVTGEALDWDDAEIDRLAEITPEDIASAKAQFKRQAPKKIKDVLDAQVEEEDE
jgi:hypothetical protein